MGYAELIERLQALPRDKQADWADSEFARMAMVQALRDIEDDPVAYTANDLRECWQ